MYEAPKRRNRGLGLAAAGWLRQTAPCAERPVDPDTDPAAAILLRVDPARPAEQITLFALATAALGSPR